jgi:hypothetical protein
MPRRIIRAGQQLGLSKCLQLTQSGHACETSGAQLSAPRPLLQSVNLLNGRLALVFVQVRKFWASGFGGVICAKPDLPVRHREAVRENANGLKQVVRDLSPVTTQSSRELPAAIEKALLFFIAKQLSTAAR